MNEQQVREIVEAAFKARFDDIDIAAIEIEAGFDFYDEPKLDVRIVYDAEVEQLIRGDHMGVRSEIVVKVWEEAEDSPGYPYVRFTSKSDLDRRAQEEAA